MAVFHFPKFDAVLIHIPKTGGTSIRTGFFEGDHSGPFHDFPEPFAAHFCFSFVRNPFDRLVSAWKMFTEGVDNHPTWEMPPGAKPQLSLRQFMDIVMDESISHHDRDSYESKIRHHAIPQTHPYYCLERADWIGRFENLEADFAHVCKVIGADGRLPHMNRTRHIRFDTYFDPETRRLAETYYEEDVRRFDFTFD